MSTQIGDNAKGQLRSIVERLENLEADKKALADDIREVYQEAKGNGFDVKALRAVVKIRKEDKAKREEVQAIIETYLSALGQLSDTPLGKAAIRKAVEK